MYVKDGDRYKPNPKPNLQYRNAGKSVAVKGCFGCGAEDHWWDSFFVFPETPAPTPPATYELWSAACR